jgi:hypothetical protein
LVEPGDTRLHQRSGTSHAAQAMAQASCVDARPANPQYGNNLAEIRQDLSDLDGARQ